MTCVHVEELCSRFFEGWMQTDRDRCYWHYLRLRYWEKWKDTALKQNEGDDGGTSWLGASFREGTFASENVCEILGWYGTQRQL